jgi:hypothetical protein
LLAAWNHLGTQPGISGGLTSLQFDDQGFALVAVPGAGRVLKIDSAGRVLDSWTTHKLQEPLLHAPRSVVTAAGNVYVTDAGRVVRIATGGQGIHSWSPRGEGRGGSSAEAVDPNGNLVLADMKAGHITTYSPNGKLLATWGRSGSKCGALGQPVAVGVNGRGDILVDDVGDSVVETFSASGTLSRCFDASSYSPLVSSTPGLMAVDRQGDFYLSLVDKVIKFSPGGAPLRSWGSTGRTPGKFFIAGAVAVDSQGNVYATDLQLDRLQVFSATGKLLACWTGLGRTGPRFGALTGVTVDHRGDIFLLNGAQLLELAPLRRAH